MPINDYSYQFYATTKEAWDAMDKALHSATKSIYWEIFIFVDDTVGNRFLDILEYKAREGVEIKMIIDAVGSYAFSRDAEKRLKASGVEILKYNQLWPGLKLKSWVRRIFNRNHRKVLIVDEEKVFLGGVNVRDTYNEWDDLYLKIEGPVARPLLRGFAKSYISAGGPPKNVKRLLHPKLESISSWREKLHFIVHSPRYRAASKINQLYIRALATASETVNLVTPYFVPNKEFLRSVALARKRGVKVNIFLPLRTDSKVAELVGRTYYEMTAKAGANLYFSRTMNHAKAVSVDKNFGAVGSMNVSRRSSRFDEEASVSFTDEQMVADLNKVFNMWKEKAEPFDREKWRKRGLLQRFQEWIGKQMEDFV